MSVAQENVAVATSAECSANPGFKKWREENPQIMLYILTTDTALPKHDSHAENIFVQEETEKALYELARKIAFKKTNYYAGEKDRGLFERLNYYKECIEMEVSEVIDCGFDILSNIFANISRYKELSSLEYFSFKSKFENAVICGFGPTLQKGLSFLKKTQNKAFIFSSASACKYLKENGVNPHFLGHIDPKQTEVFKHSSFTEPLFALLRASSSITTKAKGATFFTLTESCLPFESYIYEKLLGSYILNSRVWTATDYLVQIAKEMGFKRIFLVGADFIIENGCKYPDSAVPKEALQEAYTPRDWYFSAEEIERKGKEIEIIRIHPSSFEMKIPSQDADSAYEQFFKDIEEITIPQITAEKTSQHFSDRGKQIVKSFMNSFLIVEKLLTSFMQAAEQEDRSTMLLKEAEIEQQLYTQQILDPLWQRWEKVMVDDSLEYSLKKILFFDTVVKKHKELW